MTKTMKRRTATLSRTQRQAARIRSGKSKTALTRKRAAKSSSNNAANTAARAKGKLATIIAMLRKAPGASLDELVKATGWQSHSVRGAISGALKKKLGLKVVSAKPVDVRIYRIVE